MREMKDSGVKWIGEIPKEWCVLPNKHLMKKEKNICEKYNGEDILSLSMKGVIVRDLDAGGKMPTTFDGYQYLRKGNLLMCLFDIDVTPRCIGLIKNDGLSSPAYSQFSLSKKANAEYYYYYYLMLDNSKTLYHLAKNLRHSLTEEQLGVIPTIAPPLADQQKIAAHLDRKCTQIDALISNAQQQIEKLKAYKQSVITETVTKGLDPDVKMKDSGVEWIGEIPEHWKVTNIGRLCFVTKLAGFEYTSHMVNNLSDDGEVPVVRAQNIKMGIFIDIINDYISMELSEKLHRCALDKKCLLITFIGAGIGEVAIFNKEARYHLAPNVAKIVINENYKEILSEEFLLFYLMSYAGQEEVNKIKKATAQPSLSMETIRSIKFVIPTKNEQQAISDYLDHKCSQIDKLIALKQQKIEKLQQYKKSLIYEYVTGKKEV